ncbi:hypothetical protein Molly3_138 [Maribacter phage Molly_3]|uniref:Uncharacterized protein n=1 Tax=Maribacter phage Molly_1 TaxID=2745685 RepID=A0A8E4UY88_9CAUD|nr:hypothetical protein M1M29_gp138 [Maribacter phage Molly_1]QQO97431.1 hypothetical protein Molly1_138 [Maribacter phage Molly_1]QQO97631.1 hypothetical protein Molly2_138 [Maribacter phage Molly_2]QQO97831.1 hypothetical protein Molly3_138 [Maribacter phage Molly_3]
MNKLFIFVFPNGTLEFKVLVKLMDAIRYFKEVHPNEELPNIVSVCPHTKWCNINDDKEWIVKTANEDRILFHKPFTPKVMKSLNPTEFIKKFKPYQYNE